VLGTVLLGVVSMVTAAFTLAATALIVPGTGTPNANIVAGYKENADNYYIAPFNPLCTQANNCNLQGINYPAQFWPIPLPGWGGLSGAKWNDSTGQGILALDTALQLALPTATPQNPVVIFGYSQGGNIVSREKATLSGLTDAQKAALSFVMIGNTNRPNGGLFERLAFLGTVPIWDVTFGLPAPRTPVSRPPTSRSSTTASPTSRSTRSTCSPISTPSPVSGTPTAPTWRPTRTAVPARSPTSSTRPRSWTPR